jgi:hypothetical protein
MTIFRVPPYLEVVAGAVVAGAVVAGAVVAGAVVAGAVVAGVVLAQLPNIRPMTSTMMSRIRNSFFISTPPYYHVLVCGG